jgi:signal transduction histidine kinase
MDRVAHRETIFLARALDVLSAPGEAELRLAALLDLIAATAGASRAGVLAGDDHRQIAVSVHKGESPERAKQLGAWLDTVGPRTRAARAAAGPAPILLVTGQDHEQRDGRPGTPGARADAPESNDHLQLACLALPGDGSAMLAFEYQTAVEAGQLGTLLPPPMLRHAAAALSIATQQFRHELELRELQAQEAERTRFVSTVAHELRTPLTGLSGYLDLLLDGRIDDPLVVREFLERGRGIVGAIGELVGDLLELARLESGTLHLVPAPFSVTELGTRVMERLEPIALERGIRLRADLPPRLRTATGDRRRVEQILTNLVANAVKFARSNGSVELTARFDGLTALLMVRDEGAGIGPDDLVRIFEPFYRMDGHERVPGSGLGLPIARDLARAMDGELAVTSVPGKGSTFVLAMPVIPAVPPGVINDGLARALEEEGLRLRERSVLQPLHASGRTGRPGAARLRPASVATDEDVRPKQSPAGASTSHPAPAHHGGYPQDGAEAVDSWITALTPGAGDR